MTELTVETARDPAGALAAAGDYLSGRPVEHNAILTLLDERAVSGEQGRYWIVRDGHSVVGFALQSPTTFPVVLGPMPAAVVSALADEVAATDVSVPGCTGEAATAASFAGRWSERTSERVTVREAQRLYQLARSVAVPASPGSFRPAHPDDHDVLVKFRAAFCAETGAFGGGEPDEMVRRETKAGRLFVWDHAGVVSAARITGPVAGVVRVGFVYTPEESRGRGYAAACVGTLSARVRDVWKLRCMLFTQLANPTSNRVYRALGYEAFSEHLVYDFGAA